MDITSTHKPSAQPTAVARVQATANAALPWLLATAIAALPFYKGLFNTAIAAYILCWLLSGNFARKWARVKSSKPIALWGVLTLWVLLGMVYAQLPLAELSKPTTYVVKAIFMLMAATAIEREHLRYYLGVFVVTNVWVVLLTVGWRAGFVPVTMHATVGDWLARASTDHISQGIRLSLLVGLLLYLGSNRWQQSKAQALGLFMLSVLAALTIGYFATGRTGYLALLALLVVYAAWRRPWRVTAVGLLAVAAVAWAAYQSSDTVQRRVQLIVSESQLSGNERDHTSVGARLAMWTFAAQAISERPLLGTGSGGYPQAAKAHFQDAVTCAISCSHAHNQFLFFGVENGLIGVALYVAFIVSSLMAAWRTATPLVSGGAACVVAVLVADSLTHGPFWIANEFHFFAVAIPVALAAMAAHTATSPQATASI
ncbi:O-antigen ligase family protein [Comamonadaceae bacterium M7527]|nr:O-antigen ligase family protein [Comamonadaceae bacterium M7527]